MIRHINLALNHVAVTKAAHSFSSMSKNMCTIKNNVLGPLVVAIAIQGVDTDSSYFNTRNNPYIINIFLYSLYLSYLLNTLASNWLSMLNLYLIIIYNPSIVNPGPVNNNLGSFSVYYQNVQGLIPFSSLSDKNPKFDETKICELQNYIYESLPDVFILNETWLKPSIDNSEIFPSHLYHTFRSDRSPKYPSARLHKSKKNSRKWWWSAYQY